MSNTDKNIITIIDLQGVYFLTNNGKPLFIGFLLIYMVKFGQYNTAKNIGFL